MIMYLIEILSISQEEDSFDEIEELEMLKDMLFLNYVTKGGNNS